MSGLSGATLPAEAPAAGPPDPALARWPMLAALAAWILIGLGISAHDGEWSSWGLGALVLAFVLLLAVAAAGRTLRVPDRPALMVALAVSLVAAIVHPAYRLMHVRGAGVVAIDVLAGLTVAVALATLLMRSQRVGW